MIDLGCLWFPTFRKVVLATHSRMKQYKKNDFECLWFPTFRNILLAAPSRMKQSKKTWSVAPDVSEHRVGCTFKDGVRKNDFGCMTLEH